MRALPSCIIALLLLTPIFSFSQAKDEIEKPKEESYRAALGFGIGASFPFGSFSDKDLNVLEGGYAETGLIINLNFSYRFYKNLIATAHYSRMNNSYAQESLLSQGSNICPSCRQFLNFTSVETGDYELNALFVGMGFIKELPNYTFQMHFMLGQGNMYSPRIVAQYDGGEVIFMAQDHSAMSYAVGSSLRIHLNDQLDLSAVGNFIIYQNDEDQVYTVDGVRIQEEAKQRYQVFNLSVGLAYRIIKKVDAPKDQLRY